MLKAAELFFIVLCKIIEPALKAGLRRKDAPNVNFRFVRTRKPLKTSIVANPPSEQKLRNVMVDD